MHEHGGPILVPLPAVSVVVCAYTLERWEDITAGMAALAAQTLTPHEIILVIDHNPELAARAINELPAIAHKLVVIENRGPRGASGARNSGVAVASGQIVAFLDDDARPDPTWLAELVAPYDDPSVVGTAGLIVPAWPSGDRPKWFPEEFDWVVGCTYRGHPASGSRIRNAIAASMSLPVEVFRAAGPFREEIGRVGKIPLGCEETELSIRVLRAFPEGRIVYTAGSVVNHRVRPERTRGRYFLARCRDEGVSKAAVTRLVGTNDGLASERQYVTRTLPVAMARGMRQLLVGDLSGGLRAGAVVAGLAAAGLGYLRGWFRARASNRSYLNPSSRAGSANPTESSPMLESGRTVA